MAKGAAQVVALTTAATLGAIAGGGKVQGAAAGWNVDANNRQLHPTEAQWIKDNASRYAKQKGMSEAQAENTLAQQAFRQVQAGAAGVWDAEASAFLSQAHGMLAADPNCPSCGPGYMFIATPQQKANPEMYAAQVVSDPNALAFYGRNGIAQPTSKQIQTSVGKDAAIRSKVTNATMVAAGAAVAVTLPPALSWCLGNPVACNQIAIAGGEITAGDALGPVGLGIAASLGAKSIKSAEEMNAAARANGWLAPWAKSTPVFEGTLKQGTKVNMIVDAVEASNIRRSIQSGDFGNVKLGGWGTFDEATSVALDMRQKAAITNTFKPAGNGPFYVVALGVQKPLNANIGFAGSQSDVANTLRGGATQAEFLIPTLKKRIDYLKPVASPKKLN